MTGPDPTSEDDADVGMAFVHLVDPHRYRHYGDRRPPWIKLPERLVQDARFRALPDHAKCHAMLIIVKLERTDLFGRGLLPADAGILQTAIGASEAVNVEMLIEAGILARCAG